MTADEGLEAMADLYWYKNGRDPITSHEIRAAYIAGYKECIKMFSRAFGWNLMAELEASFERVAVDKDKLMETVNTFREAIDSQNCT